MDLSQKCGRNFRNINQNHYCGKAPETIEEYIREQPGRSAAALAAASGNHPRGDPGSQGENLLEHAHLLEGAQTDPVAASRKHIGLYPGAEAVEVFADRLTEYQTSKGTIRLPIDRPLPLELVAEIARWCEAANGK